MRVVWSWLLELVALERELTVEEGADALTGAGLEVEGIERLGAGFSGVVVAEVAAKKKHPDADALTLVELRDQPGGPTVEVVCGAPNVPEPGGRVLWAQPGAVLPGDFRIAKRRIRGIESAGMICSEQELGVGEANEGIVVLHGEAAETPLGAPAQRALGLDDVVLDLNTPANRGDVLGHLGVARELIALVGGQLRLPAYDLTDVTGTREVASHVEVTIGDPRACPRYTARVIDGLTVGPSPLWLQQRLRAVGVRPLSNLVDVTNYVLFELGQPLHAFDHARLVGDRIEVRRARAGEKLVTLDDVERRLEDGDLLICDTSGPIALAGVMGGRDSEVSDTTKRVLLESACFDPITVRRTARRLGLLSEAALRFERGVDPELAELASARAARLLAEVGGGTVERGVVDAYPAPAVAVTVPLRASRVRQVTGVALTRQDAAAILTRLGLEVSVTGEDTLAIQCPPYRRDLHREIDLIEELIRIHGYDKVPATLPQSRLVASRGEDRRGDAMRRALVAAGMSEAITFGFTSPQRVASLRLPTSDVRMQPVPLQNPMTVEQSVMRTSLLPGLLAAVARNQSFGVANIALFEVGSVFLRRGPGAVTGLVDEPVELAGVLAGRRAGWLEDQEPVDFYDAKGLLERCLAALLPSDAPLELRPASELPYWHPGVSAVVACADTVVAEVGEVHPETRRALGIETPVFGFVCALGKLPQPGLAQMRPIPKYPAVTRDISFFVAEEVPAQVVAARIRAAAEPLVEGFQILEEYRDPDKVPAGRKGMLWTVTYRSLERTLTDDEVDRVHEGIVGPLLTAIDGQRR